MGIASTLFKFLRRGSQKTVDESKIRITRGVGKGKPASSRATAPAEVRPSRSRPSFEESVRSAKKEEREFEKLASDPLHRFLIQGEWVFSPQSSNVKKFRYDIDDQALEIQFKDYSVYRYFAVRPDEAKSLYNAGSKGTWVWDNLRIRGTDLGHRKDYIMTRDKTPDEHGGMRRWPETEETAAAHWEQVAAESGAKSHKDLPEILGKGLSKFFRKTPKDNTGRRKR